MILLIFTLLFIIIMFSKIQIKLYLCNKKFKVILIILYVIKINLNAKAIKGIKEIKHDAAPIKLEHKVRIILTIIKDILERLKYIIGKLILNINVDCSYYIIAPDTTAIIYGISNTIIYNVETIFHLFLKEFNSNINLKPDFQDKNNNIRINGNIKVRILYILILLIKMLPIIFRYRKLIKSKGGEVDGSSDRGVNENYNG